MTTESADLVYAEFYYPDGRLSHCEYGRVFSRAELCARCPWGGSFRVSTMSNLKVLGVAHASETLPANHPYLRDEKTVDQHDPQD